MSENKPSPFNRMLPISPELAAFMGVKDGLASRFQVNKFIVAYAKNNGLINNNAIHYPDAMMEDIPVSKAVIHPDQAIINLIPLVSVNPPILRRNDEDGFVEYLHVFNIAHALRHHFLRTR